MNENKEEVNYAEEVEVKKEKEEAKKNENELKEEMKQPRRKWGQCIRRRNKDINKYITQITEDNVGWYNQYLHTVLKYVSFSFSSYLSLI
jgi:hypothetical protein